MECASIVEELRGSFSSASSLEFSIVASSLLLLDSSISPQDSASLLPYSLPRFLPNTKLLSLPRSLPPSYQNSPYIPPFLTFSLTSLLLSCSCSTVLITNVPSESSDISLIFLWAASNAQIEWCPLTAARCKAVDPTIGLQKRNRCHSSNRHQLRAGLSFCVCSY